MDKKSYIVAVDLGSSNVSVAVGVKNAEGTVEIETVVSKPVDGVNAGRIDNIELVGKAIKEAVTAAEEALGIRITEVYAGISGEFVRCARHTDHVFTFDPQNGVGQGDVDALFDRMRNVQAPDDEIIMERIPQNYMVDNDQEVKNPVGSFGKRLSSTFNFILCAKTPLQRLEMALKRLGIGTIGIYPNAITTPDAVLTPDEKEEGVAVVDVGGGITDVTVYYRNVVRYIASIPMGANAINRDIRSQSIPEKHVESLKQKYGSAIADLAPDDKLIRVNGRTAREAKDILLRNLATVIEARATDIAEFVTQELKDSGYSDKLAYGIVLTGGSAELKNFDELFHRVTNMDVRIGSSDMGVSETSEGKGSSPAHSTVIGILLKGAQQGSCNVQERAEHPAAAPRSSANGTGRPLSVNSWYEQANKPQANQSEAGEETKSPQTFRHIPPQSEQPIPDQMQTDDRGDEVHTIEPARKKREWGGIFKKAIDKINDGFSAGEDEEI